jgi:hypothetical protein
MPSAVAEMISAEVSSASGVFSATMKDAMRLKFMSCAMADPAQSARTEVSVRHRTDHVGLSCQTTRWSRQSCRAA